MSSARVTSIQPRSAIEGGRITIEGAGFPVDQPFLPEVRIGDARARLVFASSTTLIAIVPAGLEGGRATVRVAGVPPFDEAQGAPNLSRGGEPAFMDVAAPTTTGLPRFDNPLLALAA